jgi:hypothetical protein
MFKDRVTWVVVVGVALATPLRLFQSGWLLGHVTKPSKAAGPAEIREFLLVYLLPPIGAVAAGLISDILIRKGWSAGNSRTLLVTICGLLMALPAPFALSHSPLPSVVRDTQRDGGPRLARSFCCRPRGCCTRRGIIVGVALTRWLGGLIGTVANILAEPVTSRWGNEPLVIGFSILALFAVICVRLLTRKMPGELVPA